MSTVGFFCRRNLLLRNLGCGSFFRCYLLCLECLLGCCLFGRQLLGSLLGYSLTLETVLLNLGIETRLSLCANIPDGIRIAS